MQQIDNMTRSNVYEFNYTLMEDYLFTTIGIIACATCIINILVFLNPKLKDATYKILLVISINDFIYAFLLIFYLWRKKCVYPSCKLEVRYAFSLLSIMLDDYLSSCLALMNIFLELFCLFNDCLL